jgi:TolB-like protein
MSVEGDGPKIFLSYARVDHAQAQRLIAALKKHGFTIWWDELIEGGTQFAKSIDNALQAAEAIIVLWSKNSVESDWVRDEAAQGRDRHRLVPLSLDGTQPPLGFRQIQVIDISGWRGRSHSPQLAAVRRAVATVMGKPAGDIPLPTAPVTRRRAIGFAAAAAAAATGGVAVWKSGLLVSDSTEARSIAVLPFRNFTAGEAQDFLSEGLTEEIRAALSRNAGFLVLAGTSSEAAKDVKGGATEIARKLGVAHLLEGSVQRDGDQVRVAATLTDGATGFSEWTQRYDRHLGDVFAMQSELARSVAGALSVRIATDDPAPGGTRNPRAYEAYLKGKALYNLAKDETTDRQAKGLFDVAVSEDPEFALAHAALSRVLFSIAAGYANASELKPLYSQAVAEAERAIAIEPKLAEGHLALGYARFAGFLDVRAAKPSYELAYRYGRGSADIVLLFALFNARIRRMKEAEEAIDRAIALDPLNARTHRAAGTIAFVSRRYADAIADYRRSLELNPAITYSHAFIGDALMMLGRNEDARREYAAEPSAMFRLRGQAILEHRLQDPAAAQRAYSKLVSEIGDSALYQQAEVLAQWGRASEAVDALLKARQVGDSGLTLIATDPFFDPIAKEPRFVRLKEELGLA